MKRTGLLPNALAENNLSALPFLEHEAQHAFSPPVYCSKVSMQRNSGIQIFFLRQVAQCRLFFCAPMFQIFESLSSPIFPYLPNAFPKGALAPWFHSGFQKTCPSSHHHFFLHFPAHMECLNSNFKLSSKHFYLWEVG